MNALTADTADTGYFDRRIALANAHHLGCRAAVYKARRDGLHLTARVEYDGLVEAMDAETNGMNCWGFFDAVKTVDQGAAQ